MFRGVDIIYTYLVHTVHTPYLTLIYSILFLSISERETKISPFIKYKEDRSQELEAHLSYYTKYHQESYEELPCHSVWFPLIDWLHYLHFYFMKCHSREPYYTGVDRSQLLQISLKMFLIRSAFCFISASFMCLVCTKVTATVSQCTLSIISFTL